MPAPRINWEAVKAEYIAGDDGVTMRAIAQTHGVNYATVGRRASKERWSEARSTYRQQVAHKTLNKVSTSEAEMRARQITAGRRLQDIGQGALKNLMRKEADGSTTVLLSDPAEIRMYIATGADIERKAAGIAEERHVTGELAIGDDRQSVRSKLLPELAISGAGPKAE